MSEQEKIQPYPEIFIYVVTITIENKQYYLCDYEYTLSKHLPNAIIFTSEERASFMATKAENFWAEYLKNNITRGGVAKSNYYFDFI